MGNSRLADRIRDAMPVSVTLTDVVTGQPFTLRRDDCLVSLRLDSSRLLDEAEALVPDYAEFARAQRAAQHAHEIAEANFRIWKAKSSAAFRAKGKATVAETEEHYRSLPEYTAHSAESARLQAMSDLFGDLKQAVSIKAQLLREQLHNLDRIDSFLRTEDKAEQKQPTVPALPNVPPIVPPLPKR